MCTWHYDFLTFCCIWETLFISSAHHSLCTSIISQFVTNDTFLVYDLIFVYVLMVAFLVYSFSIYLSISGVLKDLFTWLFFNWRIHILVFLCNFFCLSMIFLFFILHIKNQFGTITIKWTNGGKGPNYKWAFYEHFEFFIKWI